MREGREGFKSRNEARLKSAPVPRRVAIVNPMLPWFAAGRTPLYLAPMAGVTDLVFRRICKELGADVMVTEFVSAEGILRRDERTRRYTEFEEAQRPVGVQLFGADGERMGEAARRVLEWKRPDFIDINFGCPVNKVVAKNGGSSLLRNCPLLASVAEGMCRAVGDLVPVTAKIRTGWDQESINAPEVCRILEDCGIQAITVHGRTRSQGYSGEADWDVIQQCVEAVRVPVIGNGDVGSGADVARRQGETGVQGLMIGRAALGYPWVFREARTFRETGLRLEPVPPQQRFALMTRHCRMTLEWGRYGNELSTMRAMRGRLMNYVKGLRGGKRLRQRIGTIETLAEVEDLAADYLASPEASAGPQADWMEAA